MEEIKEEGEEREIQLSISNHFGRHLLISGAR